MKRLLYLLLFLSPAAYAQQDILLSGYRYPFEVSYLDLNSQHQELKMAYMDVRPPNPNGRTVVLLHGKNFNGLLENDDRSLNEKWLPCDRP